MQAVAEFRAPVSLRMNRPLRAAAGVVYRKQSELFTIIDIHIHG
jgi:hypothetical protein